MGPPPSRVGAQLRLEVDLVRQLSLYLRAAGGGRPGPWPLALVNNNDVRGLRLATAMMVGFGQDRLVVHLVAADFAPSMTGRWVWRGEEAWHHRAWAEDERSVAGLCVPPAPEPTSAVRGAEGASDALLGVMESTVAHRPPGLRSMELNVCRTARHLAGLLAEGHLDTPLAVIAPEVEAIVPCPADCASAVRGRDALGDYLVTSPPGHRPGVLRRDGFGRDGGPVAGDGPAYDDDAEVMRAFCNGRPVGVLADILHPQDLAGLSWLDVSALDLAAVMDACPPATPAFVGRRGRGQRLNRVALGVLAGQQSLAALAPGP